MSSHSKWNGCSPGLGVDSKVNVAVPFDGALFVGPLVIVGNPPGAIVGGTGAGVGVGVGVTCGTPGVSM